MSGDELTLNEAFDNFKEGICQMVEMNFNGNNVGPLAPHVFLGLSPHFVEKMATEDERMREAWDNIKGHIDKHDLRKVLTMPLDISPFFEGPPMFEQFGKMMADRMVREAIKKIGEDDITAIQFSAFVCEGYMREVHLTPEEIAREQLTGKQDPETEEILKNGVKNDPKAVEKMVIIFEHRQCTDIVVYDMLRGEDYQELTNKEEKQRSLTPCDSGPLVGLLHKSGTSLGVN